MNSCSQCGTQNPRWATRCSACGAQLLHEEHSAAEARKIVTVVCCAVRNFDELSERLDPEALAQVTDVFFQEMSQALERYGATVEQWGNERILGLFGIPQVHADDALRAVYASFEMRTSLNQQNSEFFRIWRIRITIGIGIGTGEVVTRGAAAGPVAVLGDAINQASRLERIASAGDVLISDATYPIIRNAVTVEPVDSAVDKGWRASMQAWRLLALDQSAHPAPHLDAPMVGRDQEQAMLLQTFERAVANHTCQLFTILGEAGIGKSRLVQEFVSLVRERATAVGGHCLPYGNGITFWPLATAIRQAANIREPDTAQVARTKLMAILGDHEHAQSIADHVLPALSLKGTAASLEQIFWAVRRLLETIARDRPLVVVFDDLQWAETTLVDLIEHVADWSKDVPLLIVCLARPELLDARSAWGGGKLNATTILLEPLNHEECRRLLAHLLDYQQVAEDAWDRIGEIAEGNPLFLEEILGMLLDEGKLRRKAGRWLLASENGFKAAVPPSVEALIAERLERLSPDARALIQRAAIAGRTFYRGAIITLSPAAAQPSVETNLLTLIRKGFVQPVPNELADEQTYRFRHALIREAAYEALPKAQRGELHERFAEWVEAMPKGRDRKVDELVGYHLEQAQRYHSELEPGDPHGQELAARAADRLDRAAGRAFSLGDISAAANLFARAAALLPVGGSSRLEAQAMLARALRIAGDFAKANVVIGEVIEGATAACEEGLRTQALVERAFIRLYTDPEGRPEEAIAQAADAIGVFETLGDDRNLAEAWTLLSLVHLMRSDMVARREALECALLYVRRSGDTRNEAWITWGIVGSVAQGPTPAAEAAAFAGQHFKLAREKGWRFLEAGASLHLGRLQAMLGQFEEAREHVAEAQRICQELGLAFWAATFNHFLGFVEMLAGEPSAAEHHFLRGYEALGRLGEQTYRLTTAAYLAHALYELGRYEEVMDLTRSIEEEAATDDVHTQVLWRGARAKALARLGGGAEAVEIAEKAVALSQAIADESTRADALTDLAVARRFSGLPTAAAAAAAEALDLYEAKGNVVRVRTTRALLASMDTATEAGQASSTHHSETGGILS
jgi:class 3 adenylate cyclase/tetratricopeptide (TPR) repeat protein